MDEERRHERARSLLLGGIIGASAALAAGRRRPRNRKAPANPAGLAAFEDAPCYRELAETERLEPRGS